MTGVWQQHLFRQPWHRLFQSVERIGVHIPHHRIVLTCDEERGLIDLRAAQDRVHFPKAVNIAIPVEPTPEAGAAVLLNVEVDVSLSEPVGWGLSAANTCNETTAFANHGGPGTGIAKSSIEEPDNRATDIGLQFSLGPS